jgi:hypothetical protein
MLVSWFRSSPHSDIALITELGALVSVEKILDSWLYRELPNREVLIVTYGLRRTDAGPLRPSAEHRRLERFALDELDRLPMPEGYRRSIRAWAARRGSRRCPTPSLSRKPGDDA